MTETLDLKFLNSFFHIHVPRPCPTSLTDKVCVDLECTISVQMISMFQSDLYMVDSQIFMCLKNCRLLFSLPLLTTELHIQALAAMAHD
jgi:hypothetical protein